MGAGSKALLILDVLKIGEAVTAAEIQKRLKKKYKEDIHPGGIGSLINWHLAGKYVETDKQTDRATRYRRIC